MNLFNAIVGGNCDAIGNPLNGLLVNHAGEETIDVLHRLGLLKGNSIRHAVSSNERFAFCLIVLGLVRLMICQSFADDAVHPNSPLPGTLL
jgi:hypothetical protein